MYRFLCALFNLFFIVAFRREVIGVSHIPQTGGAIIAANHKSFWDPPVIAPVVPRIVYWMAKKELFSIPIFGWLIRIVAFPVKRGKADRNAIKTALNLLNEGKFVAVFPEGTRSKTDELLPGQPGLAMMAIKAEVPIVPTAVIGTDKIFRRGSFFPKLKVIFGQPIQTKSYPYDKEGIESLTKDMMDAIKQLIERHKEK